MGRLAFLTSVVLGSAASVAGLLTLVLAVFLVTSGERPSRVGEYATLWRAVLQFGALAAFAGAALVGLQQRRRWCWIAQGAMWLTLFACGWSYWPRGGP